MIEIKIQKNALSSALAVVTKASRSNGLIPVYELIRLEVSAGRLTFSCFNGEFAACGRIPVIGMEAGYACVNAATLREVVQTMNGEITLRILPDQVHLECGASKTTLHTQEGELPVVGMEDGLESLMLSGADLKKLGSVAVFASTDSARSALQTVHLSIFQDEHSFTLLRAQSADGFTLGRLSVIAESSPELDSRLETNRAKNERMSILMPAVFMRTLASVVAAEDQVQLNLNKDTRASFHITGEGRDFCLDTALMDDSFPESSIEDILTKAMKSNGGELVIACSELDKAMKQVAAMGTRSMFFKTFAGVIRTASHESEYGQAKNVLQGTATGSDVAIWLNVDFLARVTKISSGTLEIKVSGSINPALVRVEDLTVLIMPIHVEGDPFEKDQAIPVSFDLPAEVAA